MKTKIIIIVILVFLILIGCIPQLYMPSSADPTIQNQLVEGRKSYIQRCNHCHNLYRPDQFTAEQWKKNLDKMQPRAKITDDQKQIIFNYLIYQP